MKKCRNFDLPSFNHLCFVENDPAGDGRFQNEFQREAIILPTFCFMSLLKTAWSDGIRLHFL